MKKLQVKRALNMLDRWEEGDELTEEEKTWLIGYVEMITEDYGWLKNLLIYSRNDLSNMLLDLDKELGTLELGDTE